MPTRNSYTIPQRSSSRATSVANTDFLNSGSPIRDEDDPNMQMGNRVPNGTNDVPSCGGESHHHDCRNCEN